MVDVCVFCFCVRLVFGVVSCCRCVLIVVRGL